MSAKDGCSCFVPLPVSFSDSDVMLSGAGKFDPAEPQKGNGFLVEGKGKHAFSSPCPPSPFSSVLTLI
jgi:hypothetical protein